MTAPAPKFSDALERARNCTYERHAEIIRSRATLNNVRVEHRGGEYVLVGECDCGSTLTCEEPPTQSEIDDAAAREYREVVNESGFDAGQRWLAVLCGDL